MLTEAEGSLTAQEVAEHLGVHERTVRRWIEAGRLPAAKRGASFAIAAGDVEKLATASLRKRVLARVDERERDAAYLELQGQFKLLSEMYEKAQVELAEERRRVARLELELEVRAA